MRVAVALAAICTLAICILLPCSFGAALAQDKTYTMKFTTPTINAAPDRYARNLATAIEKDSGGRIKTSVYPASQLGSIPRTIEGTQFGSIQCAVIPPEFYVGVDQRFELLAAPGLLTSDAQGRRLAADPAVNKLMLGLGANKGLHGAALFFVEPAEVVTTKPIRHLADFRGKKLRIFASDFQSVAFERLGSTPVAMSPADVLPAMQQGALDGAAFGVQLASGLHYYDSAKYVTMAGHSTIFIVVEFSKTWYESLPADLRQIVDRDAAREAVAINPQGANILDQARKTWVKNGGELIYLPPQEQAAMLKNLSSVGADVAAKKPAIQAAYQIVREAAERLK